jgi:hypothetical protein
MSLFVFQRTVPTQPAPISGLSVGLKRTLRDVIVQAKDANGVPLPAAVVTLAGLSRPTDVEGKARFRLAPGSYEASITAGPDFVDQHQRIVVEGR